MSGIIFRLILAFVITLSAAYYQRKSGPTYPVKDEVSWKESEIKYELKRSFGGEGDQPVEINVADSSINAYVFYRRFKTDTPWIAMKMMRVSDRLLAALPHQPPAGKLEYFILLNYKYNYLTIPKNQTVITRFKGDVPDGFLIPHIFFMFLAMLLSSAAGLEAISNGKLMNKLTMITTILLFIGGMILGPIVQKYAFGVFWSGVPWGMDLTDNKILIAVIFWIIALWKSKSKKSAKGWIITASIILLLVFTIPHSTLGSELNYRTMQVETGN